MKNIFYISILVLTAACAKQTPVQQPGELHLSESEMETSKNRTKDLNNLERTQIEDWIKFQEVKYYPMGMNYWVNIQNLDQQPRKNNGEIVSYSPLRYDFYVRIFCLLLHNNSIYKNISSINYGRRFI